MAASKLASFPDRIFHARRKNVVWARDYKQTDRQTKTETYTHLPQCCPASVGLAQARPNNGYIFIAERLSARLLIVQCIYIYPSHFNCVGTVSVVSSPDY